jgi:hypothetical protein
VGVENGRYEHEDKVESGCLFDNDGGTIREYFRHPASDLRRIIPKGKNGIRTEFLRMLDHQLVGFSSRLFAELSKETDIASKEDLDSGADVSDEGTRSDDDPANNSQISDHAVSLQTDICRHK